MAAIDISKWKRNPSKIQSYFNTNKDVVTVTADLEVYFPERYITRELAFLDTDVRVISLYCIKDKQDNYAITRAPIFVRLTPSNIEEIKLEDSLKNYRVLTFPKGTVYTPNVNCIVRDNFVYNLFDEFYLKGNIPFYLEYTDLPEIFAEAKAYTNTGIGEDLLAYEFISSVVTRVKKDKTKYIRHSKDKHDTVYVGLNDIYFSYNNTGAKLFGNYLTYGINSAIIDKEEKTSDSTKLLRS